MRWYSLCGTYMPVESPRRNILSKFYALGGLGSKWYLKLMKTLTVQAVLVEKFQLVVDAYNKSVSIEHTCFFPHKFVLLKLTKDPTPYNWSALKVKRWDTMWDAIDGDGHEH
jgi:hypothetical protein